MINVFSLWWLIRWILAGPYLTELLKLLVSLGEVSAGKEVIESDLVRLDPPPVGEVEDGKNKRKKVSGDHINTLAAV